MSGPDRPMPEPDRVTYHHVGSGVTTSVHFCRTCDGWYGVPHDTYDHQHRFRDGCACRPCQERSGRYPNEGVMMTHSAYLIMRASDERPTHSPSYPCGSVQCATCYPRGKS